MTGYKMVEGQKSKKWEAYWRRKSGTSDWQNISEDLVLPLKQQTAPSEPYKLMEEADNRRIVVWICLPMQETQETQVESLGREEPLEEEMAAHSSIVAWKTSRTEESSGYSPWGPKESDITECTHSSTQSGQGCNLFNLLYDEHLTCAIWLWQYACITSIWRGNI